MELFIFVVVVVVVVFKMCNIKKNVTKGGKGQSQRLKNVVW